MIDLYIGMAVVGILSVGLFFFSLWLSHSTRRWVADLLAVLVVVAMFFYIEYLWHNVRLASWLPYSNLVVLGNWFPLAAGLLGGLAWHRIPGRIVRKTVSVTALAAVSIYSLVSPILGETPRCLDQWIDQQCVQTTRQTCSAACAATLLRSYGFDASEQEMAELCLTRKGTTWMGLYRGLKLKTSGSRFDVEVVECGAEQLLAMKGPSILNVGLPSGRQAGGVKRSVPKSEEEVLVEEWGWKPGLGHSVILLESNETGAVIVDPTPGYGSEHWSLEDLDLLFRGIAFRIVERS